MAVHAALTPGLATVPEAGVCIVVDVLRATTTLCSMLDAGCTDIVVADTVDEATAIGLAEGRLLCGERGGLPPRHFDFGNSPRHFDFGNSPRQFSQIDLTGRPVAFATTNGTRALQLARSAPLVLAGSVRNADAVAVAAVAAASSLGLDLHVICAGRMHGRSFALDDAFCAGMIVERVVAATGVPDHADDSPTTTAAHPESDDVGRWGLTDGAVAVLCLYRSFVADHGCPGSAARAALSQSASGRGLSRLGLGDDVLFCAQPDATTTVPVASARSGRVTVRRL